jgi:hypothetical protein
MGCERRRSMTCALLAAIVLTIGSPVFGQAVLRGSIAGAVRDETGAALPGVNVTVTSPPPGAPAAAGLR